MNKRISFESKKIRDLFFRRFFENNNFKTWKEVYSYLELPRKTLESYKSGRLTLPESVFNKMISVFDQKDTDYFNKNISFFENSWGRIKGGKAAYLKNKIFFDEGRIKGMLSIEKLFRIRKPKFDLNLPLNKKLSYFIGLFIGDGFTNKYGRYYLTQFTGNKVNEKVYYEKIISAISLKLFGITPKIKEELNVNALRFNLYSKDLFTLITNRFNIQAGRKTKDVLIPEEILKANSEILFSCIAGIYDAEGCFYYDKRENYKKPYPAIALHMNNPTLIKQISKIFLNNSIKHSFTSSYSTLYIYGKTNVKNFLDKINLLNPKYTEKIKQLNS